MSLSPEIVAIHTWIREDVPLSMKMIISPAMIAALTERLNAARSEAKPIEVEEVASSSSVARSDADIEVSPEKPISAGGGESD